MKLEDQVLLSFYQDISPLADNPRIMLVRHVETGQIYVRKKLSLENREIYRLLQTQQVSGIPRIHLLVETEQELIIIEEYISGLSLDAYLQKEGVLKRKGCHICNAAAVPYAPGAPQLSAAADPSRYQTFKRDPDRRYACDPDRF